ncbi:hypothetical protein ZHAS_00016128 [Anopheles sinensis]|uniref:Uncharacterized protein n=1 Tax=Anopheles sinensis TaxID=74873 RepID=A0A084WCR8_ANOSI|nr:hypothetical protein ZHAS_00016128 [Anopheles sinensis]
MVRDLQGGLQWIGGPFPQTCVRQSKAWKRLQQDLVLGFQGPNGQIRWTSKCCVHPCDVGTFSPCHRAGRCRCAFHSAPDFIQTRSPTRLDAPDDLSAKRRRSEIPSRKAIGDLG